MGTRSTISRASFFAATAVMSIAVPVVHASPLQASQVVSLEDFKSYQQASAWRALHDKLQVWGAFEQDWDTEGAIPPSAASVDLASDFLNVLEAQEAPLPIATIAADGEISFEWSNKTGFASASFTDDGHVIAYLREDDMSPILRVDEPGELDPLGSFLERIGAFA